MPSVDKDLPEKIALQRLLWQKGYCSFLDVPVIALREEIGVIKKDEVTDADVLGFFFDETLARQIDIGDCKSAKESHNRLLWLKGLQSYLHATSGHFVGPEINKRFPEIAKRLKLNLWSVNDIDKILGEQKAHVFKHLFTESSYGRYKDICNNVKDGKKSVYSNFLRYHYWRLVPKRRLQSVLYNCLQVSNDFSAQDIVLLFRSVIKTSLSLLDVGSFIMAHDRKNIHSSLEGFLFGSADEIANKKEITKTKGGNESDFYPKYYQELLELMATVIRRADSSRDVVRFFQEYLFESDFLKNELSLADFSDSYRDVATTAKIAKDIVIFFCKATQTDQQLFSRFLEI